jgi:D-lactate dehydrogenase (cytochrome)
MQAIRAVDARDNSLTAEAGCTLVSVQAAAEAAERLFPLSLASEGTARIGGLISTNAGGTGVLRYGSMRDLVLGLEIVLADGRVWNGLRNLRKNNTGYDVKQWFVGAEGTLGIVTAAVLKLFPRPRAVETALIGVPDPEAAIDLLSLARGQSGEQVTAFELVPRIGVELVVRHLPGAADPLAEPHPWYVLLELSSGARADLLTRTMEDVLAEALERGLARDAVVAKSAEQAKALWRLRESLSEMQSREGGSIKHDISVPVSAMAAFIAQASAAVEAEMPGIRPVPFGHVGDGNVHFNLSQPVGMDRAAYLAQWDRFARIVHDIADGFGGSISAEHGLGQLKNNEVTRYRDPLETELMQRLKRALDPDGILNPGKVLPDEKTPNTETQAAMEELERGGSAHFDSVQHRIKDLGTDD